MALGKPPPPADNRMLNPDLAAELEYRLARAGAKRYLERLDLKQRADVKIAEDYMLRAAAAGRKGARPSSALTEAQLRFLTRMINQHGPYFSGALPIIGGLGI